MSEETDREHALSKFACPVCKGRGFVKPTLPPNVPLEPWRRPRLEMAMGVFLLVALLVFFLAVALPAEILVRLL